jgi:hypothetical protein
MTDGQYSWLSTMTQGLLRSFDNVPIHFLDAPKDVVK